MCPEKLTVKRSVVAYKQPRKNVNPLCPAHGSNAAAQPAQVRLSNAQGHLQADGDVVLPKPGVLADEERTAGRPMDVHVRVGGLGRVILPQTQRHACQGYYEQSFQRLAAWWQTA